MKDVVIVSPHLDDAALSCSSRLLSGIVAKVVTVFAGSPALATERSEWDRLTRAESAYQRVVERREEDRAAWSSIDQAFVHLEYPEVSATVLDKEQLLLSLREEVRDSTMALIPAGVGGHAHHILVRDIALAAVSPQTKLVLYGELPYAAFFGWHGDSCKNLDTRYYWESAVAQSAPSNYAWVPRLLDLNEAEKDWKMRLLSHYKTQIAAVSGGSLDLFRQTAMLNHELEFDLEEKN